MAHFLTRDRRREIACYFVCQNYPLIVALAADTVQRTPPNVRRPFGKEMTQPDQEVH